MLDKWFHQTRIWLLTVCVVGSLTSVDVASAQRSQLKKVVDDVVKQELKQQNIAGAAIGMIVNGKVIYTQGYGMADIVSGKPYTVDTVINWASNSKPVVAVLAMQLVQDNKLDLDATIDTYLPDIPQHLRKVTTRHLLCHQSGIPHYSNGKIVPTKTNNTDDFDPQNAIRRFINSPLIFEPGQKNDYSSYAFVLLTAVVQAAGNEPIAKQLSKRITTPLSMNSIQLDVAFDNQPNWSKAYRWREGQFVEVSDYANYWKHGAGGYKSNIKDFAAFANSLMNTKLMNLPTSIQMMTPQKTKNGKVTNRGLGVIVTGTGKSLKISHGGTQSETKTRMAIYPNDQHGIVFMCNCSHADPGKITTAVYSALKKNRIKY